MVKIFKEISKHLVDIDITPEYKFICAGDWNLIFDATRDSRVLKRKAIFQLKSIMSNYDLVFFLF